MEVKNSSWIYELTKTLKMHDHDAQFMDQARHFLLPLQDDFLEIIAWTVRAEYLTAA